jgi:peptidoglycan/LPS O-acetylase OafA/YrhL
LRLARLRTGEWIAGMAGVVLLVVMFLRWYQVDSRSIDAWEAFSVTDIFLAAAAIAGILAAVLTAANTKPDAPITWESGTVLVAFIAAILATYRLIDPPDNLTRCYGVYLGLIAVLAVLVGAFLAERDEYTRGA